MKEIREAYYSIGNLLLQREWLSKHLICNQNEQSRFKYFLPNINLHTAKLQVCKSMFLSVVGISDSQVRTVLRKSSPYGTLEGEGRGGR